MTSIWWHYSWIWENFTPFSSVFVVVFEPVFICRCISYSFPDSHSMFLMTEEASQILAEVFQLETFKIIQKISDLNLYVRFGVGAKNIFYVRVWGKRVEIEVIWKRQYHKK